MQYVKEIATGAGALCCAVAIGFVMQNSEAAQARYGTQEEAPTQSIEEARAANAVLDVQSITLTSAEFENTIALPAPDEEVIKASASPLPEAAEAPLAAPEPQCDITAEARAKAGAMVEVTLAAGCLPDERVTLHHNGMIFTDLTDEMGALKVEVPALARDAVFILAFVNGDGAVAQARVDDINDYQRSVLQWRGKTGFQVHAREFGAGYGEQGHIWMGAPGALTDAVLGESGHMTRHGNTDLSEGLMAEVYTFPAALSDTTGKVLMSVEAEVSEANCGIEIEAQSLEMQTPGEITTRNLTLPVPDCDAAGSFLVLNNLLADLTIAAR